MMIVCLYYAYYYAFQFLIIEVEAGLILLRDKIIEIYLYCSSNEFVWKVLYFLVHHNQKNSYVTTLHITLKNTVDVYFSYLFS